MQGALRADVRGDRDGSSRPQRLGEARLAEPGHREDPALDAGETACPQGQPDQTRAQLAARTQHENVAIELAHVIHQGSPGSRQSLVEFSFGSHGASRAPG
jgi:hypothetical protein